MSKVLLTPYLSLSLDRITVCASVPKDCNLFCTPCCQVSQWPPSHLIFFTLVCLHLSLKLADWRNRQFVSHPRNELFSSFLFSSLLLSYFSVYICLYFFCLCSFFRKNVVVPQPGLSKVDILPASMDIPFIAGANHWITD